MTAQSVSSNSTEPLDSVMPRPTILSWVITPIFVLTFFAIMVGFHVIQVAASLISRKLQKDVLDLMNLCIILNVRFVSGGSFAVRGNSTLPVGRPVIVVSNHQSMYDIPMLMWVCRDRELGFIAKKELGRWVPSVSFALRTLGSVLIDRKDVKQSLAAISAFGRRKSEEKQVACIFPEGTRARDGMMKRFKPGGLQTLIQAMPDAIIQPVAIDGNWELFKFNFMPVPLGTSVVINFLDPIEPSTVEPSQLPSMLEMVIRRALGQEKVLTASEEGEHRESA